MTYLSNLKAKLFAHFINSYNGKTSLLRAFLLYYLLIRMIIAPMVIIAVFYSNLTLIVISVILFMFSWTFVWKNLLNTNSKFFRIICQILILIEVGLMVKFAFFS